jgi:hypothetical protein
VPPEFRDDGDEPRRAATTEFRGDVCITHHFQATAAGVAAAQAAAAASATPPSRPAAPRAAAAPAPPGAGDDDEASSGSWAAPCAAQMPGPEATYCEHDFVFEDLQLAKPSRMKPFFVVFAASVLDTDLLYAAWHVPSIAICRADQTDNACKVLGLPTTLAAIQSAPPPALRAGGGDAWREPLPSVPLSAVVGAGAAAAAAGADVGAGQWDQGAAGALGAPGLVACSAAAQSGTSMPPVAPLEAAGVLGLASCNTAWQAPPRGTPPPPSFAAQAGLMPPPAAAARAAAASGDERDPAEAEAERQELLQIFQTQRLDRTGSEMVSALLGGGGGPPLLGQPWPQKQLPRAPAGGAGSGAAPLPVSCALAAPEQPPQLWLRQLQQQAQQHGSSSSPDASNSGGCLLPLGEPAAPAAAAPAAAPASRPPPPPGAAVPRPPSRAALRTLLLQSYCQLGFARQLSEGDLARLEEMAGFGRAAGAAGSDADAAAIGAAVAQPEWEFFLAGWVQTLSLLRLIHRLWDATAPAAPVAGFHFDRATVADVLRAQPVGTFVCRVSFSQPGCLIVSCRAHEAHPQADADGAVHVVLTAAQLRQRRADSWLRALPGASHALDVYTGARVDKRKLLEGDYVAVSALAPAAAAAAAAAPRAAAALLMPQLAMAAAVR